MKMRRGKIWSWGIGLTASVAVFLPAAAQAAIVPCGRRGMPPCTMCDFIILGQSLVNYGLRIVAIVAITVITIAGVMYVVSAGNEATITAAKNAMKYAIGGTMVVLLAWILINTLIHRFLPTSNFQVSGSWASYQCGATNPTGEGGSTDTDSTSGSGGSTDTDSTSGSGGSTDTDSTSITTEGYCFTATYPSGMNRQCFSTPTLCESERARMGGSIPAEVEDLISEVTQITQRAGVPTPEFVTVSDCEETDDPQSGEYPYDEFCSIFGIVGPDDSGVITHIVPTMERCATSYESCVEGIRSAIENNQGPGRAIDLRQFCLGHFTR